VGARTMNVIGMIASEVVRFVIPGIAAGTVAALGLARLASGLLFGIGFADAGVYGSATIIVLCVALVASLAPARRAASVDPMAALRRE
jgi:putative ABC transport system permease protein